MNSALVGLVASAVLGWADISVVPNKGDRTLAAWEHSIASLDRPSARTLETLRRYDLETRYRRDPEAALASLERTARQGPEAELVYALAEMSWIEGRKADGRRIGFKRGRGPLHYYVDTVAYAYDYLFDPTLANGRRTIDPRYRLACDLYNGALDRLLRAAKAQGKLQPGGAIRMKIGASEHVFRLTLEEHSLWKAADVHELLLATDFDGRRPGQREPRSSAWACRSSASAASDQSSHQAGQGAGQVLPARDGLPAHGHPPPQQEP